MERCTDLDISVEAIQHIGIYRTNSIIKTVIFHPIMPLYLVLLLPDK